MKTSSFKGSKGQQQIMRIQTTAHRGTASRQKVQSIDSARQNPTNLPPTTPAKSAFVAKCDRETWADAWLNGRASLMQLTRSNKGFGMLAIEHAVLTEINNRMRRSETLARVFSLPVRRAA
jgi:hypothetical protein